MTNIVSFQEAMPNVNQVGGKGASLIRMIQAGIPVPDGFVITVDCFNESGGKIDENLATVLMENFDSLGPGPVAVRSSAVAEDGSAASWAGLLESYLFINRAGFLSAVKQCWQSMDSERAKVYAKEQQTPQANMVMAVVVQQMASADVAGVLFTANPVSGNSDEIIIEAVWGLGETLVQGVASPENWVLNKGSGKVISHSQHFQEEKAVQANNGVKLVALSLEERTQEILNFEYKHQLLELSKKIEKLYGCAQDIEWAIADGKVYILQARPITTL